jgi:hypothetical protein
VAQIGAAIGREFSYAVLAAVLRKPEAELQSALDRIVAAGLLSRQGMPPHAAYLFKHALVQDAACCAQSSSAMPSRPLARATLGPFGDVADRTLALAEKQEGSVPLTLGHNLMGSSLVMAGEIALGKAHLDKIIALYDPDEHRLLAARFVADARVMGFVYRSIALWMLGYPEAALADADRAIKDAHAVGHTAPLMVALSLADLTYMLCGNYAAGSACMRELAALAEEKGSFFWNTVAQSIEARYLALIGCPAKALPLLSFARSAFSLDRGKSPSNFRFVLACEYSCCARAI